MTTQQTNRAGGQGPWIGGFAAGGLAVVLAAGALWMMQRRPEPAPAPQPALPPMAQPTPPPAAPADEHDHAAVEAEIAGVPRISPEALATELEAGSAVVIDVRDQQSYIAGHIPGALQIPLQFVEGEIPYLPRDRKLVTYCSCPAEETSGLAVLTLQKGGLTNTAALQGGYDLWVSTNLPVETGLPKKVN